MASDIYSHEIWTNPLSFVTNSQIKLNAVCNGLIYVLLKPKPLVVSNSY